jgi:hypothetical protein
MKDMQDFTFIFMLYNLEDSYLDPASLAYQRYQEVYKQLEKCNIPEKVNIILIRHNPDRTTIIPKRFYKNTIISQMRNEGKEVNTEDPLFNLGVRNLGAEDSLAGIFLLIKTHFPAHKYVLYINDHSNFIGHLTSKIAIEALKIITEGVDNKLTVDNTKLNDQYEGFKRDHPTAPNMLMSFIQKVITPDFTNPDNYDMLTNAELANAIYKAFSLNPISGEKNLPEAIFFNTCYTGTIDNLYLYAGKVKYIVASEGETYYNSFHIPKIIERFVRFTDSKSAISNILTDFENDFKELNPDQEEYQKMILTAFDITNNFKEKFREIFNSLLIDLIADKEVLNLIITRTKESVFLTDCWYIFNTEEPDESKNEFETQCVDFFKFFKILQARLIDQEYNKKITALLDFLNNDVMFPNPYIGTGIDKECFEGLSIFFNQDVNKIDEKKKKQLAYNYSFFSDCRNDFAKEIYWSDFIQIFQKYKLITGAQDDL